MSANRHEVGHFEIPADNVDGLRNFYSSLFGWEFEKGQTQGYYMIKNAGISGALAQKENPQQVSTQFVRVESIEDYINKAKQLGARVVKDRQEISEGYYAVLEDPEKFHWNMAEQAIVHVSSPFYLIKNLFIMVSDKFHIITTIWTITQKNGLGAYRK